jgi:hypothetical protein
MAITFILHPFSKIAPSSANQSIFKYLFFLFISSTINYVFHLLTTEATRGTIFGLYQVYRLAQFIFVFWFTAHIPFSPYRLAILKWISTLVLLIVSIGIILTFFSIVTTSTLAGHLPQDIAVSGPWFLYSIHNEAGGTIGYNHAYPAVQILVLLALRLYLSSDQKSKYTIPLLILSLFSVFLTGSRAGFAAAVFFMAIFLFKSGGFVQYYLFSVFALVISILLMQVDFVIPDYMDDLTRRQATILEANDTENLSGRADIWDDRIEFLNQEPLRWIFGTGFGSAAESGNNGHMLFLHIIVETGLIGLVIFLYLFGKIIFSLSRYEIGVQPILLVTIALLFSSITQESFYPVPALAHFLGFYFFCLAVALRKSQYKISNEEQPHSLPPQTLYRRGLRKVDLRKTYDTTH